MRKIWQILLVTWGVSVAFAGAALEPHALFSDHAVLQAGKELPIWGWAEPGAPVSVRLAGRDASTRADSAGRWRVNFDPMPPGGPHRLEIVSEDEEFVFEDILFGEVWFCGGQSNMGVKMRGREGNPVVNRDAEAARADRPRLRYFDVRRCVSMVPRERLEGRWVLCDPATVFDFSAVAYFFGRDLLASQDVPVGLIHGSWGGTGAQYWISAEGLAPLDRDHAELAMIEEARARPEETRQGYASAVENWYLENDPGSRSTTWADPTLDDGDWERMRIPTTWEDSGHPGFDGVVWFRRSFDLPVDLQGRDLRLSLGNVDYANTVWINGRRLGQTDRKDIPSIYTIPADWLRAGGNLIAVRIYDGQYSGGLSDSISFLGLEAARGKSVRVDLAGEWRCRFSTALKDAMVYPEIRWDDVRATSLYNGMIAPLQPCALRGVVWYQGESNMREPLAYRDLFPALVEDWRRNWGQGAFPFLYVQVAPYHELPPELREAQLLALDRMENTAMVVTTDVGEVEDVHPLNKEPVGARLALAARAVAYGEPIEYSGPIFVGAEFSGDTASVRFEHVGYGLVAPGGVLRGFVLAGADGVFHPAEAWIEAQQVVVRSSAVAEPVAVRYGWANVPAGNLFNADGLPASPFRSDVE